MLTKTKLSIILSILTLSFNLNAQITFEKTYEYSEYDAASSVRQTPDGGYIIGGTNLVKIDEHGLEEWSKPYPSNFTNLTSDQNYILVHHIKPDIFITKVDVNGDTLWQTIFNEGVWANEGNYIEETNDGGFIVTGRYQSVTGSGMLLLKLNNVGNKVWLKTFTESTSAGFCTGYSVQQTADNGYILTGNAHLNYNDSTKNKDVFIVKTDSLGNEEWRRFFGSSEDDGGYSVIQDNNNNYLIAGRMNGFNNTFGSDMYLIKLDINGDSVWTQTYGGMYMEAANSIWQTNDNGYILTGSSNTFSNGDFDGYIVKTDNSGDTLWTKHFGGTGVDALTYGQQTSDNGFIFAGLSSEIGSGNIDTYVLKTDPLGNVLAQTNIIETSGTAIIVDVYPNPSQGGITINSEETMSAITIFNVLGKTVYSGNSPSKTVLINLDNQPKGIYIYQVTLENNEGVMLGKFVIR